MSHSTEAHFGIDRLGEISDFISLEGNIGSGKTTLKRAIERYVEENHLSALEVTPYPRSDVYLLIDEPVAQWSEEVYGVQNSRGQGANGDKNRYSLLGLFYKEMKEKMEARLKEEDPVLLDQVAFTFQVTAFTSRLKNLRDALSRMPHHPAETRVHIISERSLRTDRLFFTNLDGSGFIPDYQWRSYNDFFDIICDRLITKHDRIVYLPTSPQKSYTRIASRSRDEEVKNDISLDYLESLHAAHTTMITKFEEEHGTDAVIRVNFEQDLVPPQIDSLVQSLMREELHA